ncbi:unnamed protein product [Choristocarpus tenellus]
MNITSTTQLLYNLCTVSVKPLLETTITVVDRSHTAAMTKTKGSGPGPRGKLTLQKRLLKAYLMLYNIFTARGWIQVFFQLSYALLKGEGTLGAVNAMRSTVEMLQLISTLEFLHSFLGLVKSSPVNLIMQQIGGRDLALFSMVTAIPATRDSPWVLLMFAAWTFSEIIRYPYYALLLIGECPASLHWLRYSAFIVLYPLGFAGELGTWIVGMPYMKEMGLYEIPGLPSGSVSWVLYAYLVLAFGFGAPKLYTHMLRQRKKQLQTPVKFE